MPEKYIAYTISPFHHTTNGKPISYIMNFSSTQMNTKYSTQNSYYGMHVLLRALLLLLNPLWLGLFYDFGDNCHIYTDKCACQINEKKFPAILTGNWRAEAQYSDPIHTNETQRSIIEMLNPKFKKSIKLIDCGF